MTRIISIDEIRDKAGKKFLYVKVSDEIRGVITITKDIKIKIKGSENDHAHAVNMEIFSNIFFFGVLAMALIILLLVIRYFFIN